MDKIYYEKILYRIIQGRLRLPFCDPVLYLYEPDPITIEESFDYYDSVYKEAYFSGLYIKDELKEILFENELWTPDDDKRADEIEKQMEELKVEAYENYWDGKKLRGIKLNLRQHEKNFITYKSKIRTLDHVSCDGVASFARSLWVISKSLRDINGNLPRNDQPISKILDYQNRNAIKNTDMRYIARNEPFKSMWSCGESHSGVFGVPSSQLSKDQLSLCQFALMYQRVHENPDSPDEKVINDDDCLDGWFITKKREYDKSKNRREIESMIKNPKISNSQEVFVMANGNQAKLEKIFDMNDPQARNIIKARNETISQKSSMRFNDLPDVRQNISMEARQKAIQTIKNKGK